MRITPAHAGKRNLRRVTNRVREDHPRTRGEKYAFLERMFMMSGSPPHTRGKAVLTLTALFIRRITPAHAGKSVADVAVGLPEQDHPRTRGEKYHWSMQWVYVRRITPAHAGKSSCFYLSILELWDHPRTRGEKAYDFSAVSINKGSPPHTRGKGI